MKVDEIEEKIRELQEELEVARHIEEQSVGERYRNYILQNDDKTLDWANKSQPKYFLYQMVDSGQFKIGKTTEMLTPFVTYASSPQLIKKAVDFVGEEIIKRNNSDLPYKESEPLFCYEKQKEYPRGYYVYDENREFLKRFVYQQEAADFCGCSQGSISRACIENKSGLYFMTKNKYYVKRR